MKTDKFLNPGGINGTGTGIVNVNSEDFKALQQAIIEHNKKYTPEERMKYDLIALHIQMKSYVSKDYDRAHRGVGEFLKGYINAIGIKNKVFAQYIEIEDSNLSAQGERKVVFIMRNILIFKFLRKPTRRTFSKCQARYIYILI